MESSEQISQAPKGVKKPNWILPISLLLLVIIIDQMLKYWVKNHMILHTEKVIFKDWFYLHFIENEGMAFGMKFFGVIGKYALSILRIGVAVFGFWYLLKSIKNLANIWFLMCVALILGGAIGNIIDCTFYGIWYQHMNEYEGGFLLGHVVDMLYFPIVETHYPEWSPIKPGEEFIFFSPVFNLADAAISIGVIAIVLFQKHFFPKTSSSDTADQTSSDTI